MKVFLRRLEKRILSQLSRTSDGIVYRVTRPLLGCEEERDAIVVKEGALFDNCRVLWADGVEWAVAEAEARTITEAIEQRGLELDRECARLREQLQRYETEKAALEALKKPYVFFDGERHFVEVPGAKEKLEMLASKEQNAFAKEFRRQLEEALDETQDS